MKKNIIKFCLILTIFFLLPFFSVLAQEKKDPITFIPQVTIPKSSFQAGVSTTMSGSLSTLGNYVKSIYNYLILIVGLVAAIALMVAGIIWLTAAGNSSRISSAKSWIGGSLTGLVLALSSYLILQTINPALVDFRDQNITSIGEINIGCCRIPLDTDKDGYLTGLPAGKGLTRDLTANQCYLRAAELGEPGLKTIKELKNDPTYKDLNDNAIVEKYLGSLKIGASTGWFLPGYTSVNFTGCDKKGTCFVGDKNLYDNYDEDGMYTGEKVYLAHCFTTLEAHCKNFKNVLQETYSTSRDYFYIFNNSYFGCSGDFIKNAVLTKLPENLSSSTYTQDKISIKNPNIYETTSDKKMYWFKNNLWYLGYGNSGEPCGNEGGVCVPSGRDCEEIKTGGDRDLGGRSCASNFKCCKGI